MRPQPLAHLDMSSPKEAEADYSHFDGDGDSSADLNSQFTVLLYGQVITSCIQVVLCILIFCLTKSSQKYVNRQICKILISSVANILNILADINIGYESTVGVVIAFFMGMVVFFFELWVYWSFSFNMLRTSRKVESIYYNMLLSDNENLTEHQKTQA